MIETAHFFLPNAQKTKNNEKREEKTKKNIEMI